MERLPEGCIDLVVADPPYNIGYVYDTGDYDDNLTDEQYLDWTHRWLTAAHRVLKPNGTLWVAMGDEYVADVACYARTVGFCRRSWVVWYYTFGAAAARNYARSHTHLLYLVKNPNDFVFNKHDGRIPSARQLLYNDKRANPAGKLPDNTWIITPTQLGPDGFSEVSDTWHVPRVAGTFTERRHNAPTQLPEQLVARIVRHCSHPGDMVFDPFAGTGTTAAVARKLHRAYLTCDTGVTAVNRARYRVSLANPGDSLHGNTPQGTLREDHEQTDPATNRPSSGTHDE
jgi:site-specific DNA-methyltransferase (adenine-specific)